MEIRSGPSLIRVIPVSPAEALPAQPPSTVLTGSSGWQLQQTVGKVLKAISFADPMNGYAAAELGAVYRTTNGGLSWSAVMDLGFPYYWYGVKAFSSQTALIVGFQNQTGAGIARWTDDGGATWTSDIVIDPANWLIGLQFSDSLHGIAFGNLGYVYVTQNGGRRAEDWRKVMTDPALGWLAGNFTFRPDLNVFITGIRFSRSTDGGYTWALGPSADPMFDQGCSFPDLSHGWTGGGAIYPYVLGWVHRTTDGGANWSGRLMEPPYPIRIVMFFNANFGFAAGGNIYSNAGGIWSTADSGNSWNLDFNTGAEIIAIDTQQVDSDSIDVWCAGFLPNLTGVIYKKRFGNPAPVAPNITTQPSSRTVTVGDPVTFTVVAIGTAPLIYQWKFGPANVGTNSASFAIPSVHATDAGNYTVWVSNSVGTATSNVATLTVNLKAFDLNVDGVTNVLDLAYVINALAPGVPVANSPADLNGDGYVDDTDLALLLAGM